MQNPKKYRKLLVLLVSLYFHIWPFKGTIGHLRKPPRVCMVIIQENARRQREWAGQPGEGPLTTL